MDSVGKPGLWGTGFDPARTHWLGVLQESDYHQVLAQAMCTTTNCSFCVELSLLESMAAGCAIVASDTAPVREVLRNGKTPFWPSFTPISRHAAEQLNDPSEESCCCGRLRAQAYGSDGAAGLGASLV